VAWLAGKPASQGGQGFVIKPSADWFNFARQACARESDRGNPMTSTPPRRSARRVAGILFAAALLPALPLLNHVSAQTPEPGGKQKKKGGGIDWNERAAPWGKLKSAPAAGQDKSPFKLFDNVYYVGLQTVAIYLITTSEGLVLLDAGYAYTTDSTLAAIRQLGFDPRNIKYIIVSHAHGDHFAGAGAIIQAGGGTAKVIMSQLDWEETERRQAAQPQTNGIRLPRDMVVRDGQAMKIGDTTFTFYVSPGHTAGALTAVYPVRDGNRTYRAVSPGGLGFNFGPEWTEPYVRSFQRLKTLGPFDTVLPNHAYMAPRDLFEVEKDLKSRAGGAHAAVFGAERINAWLDQIISAASQKLAFEKANPPPARQ
jgi:metallo-beta-lactamase class B